MLASHNEDKSSMDTQEATISSKRKNKTDQDEIFATSLPQTPSKNPPVKKVKEDISMSEFFSAIQSLSIKQDATLSKVSIIERATEETSKKIDNLSETVNQLREIVSENKEKITFLENELKKMQSKNNELCENVVELQRYSRRWNLKIQGVKEVEGEDIREVVINILGKVAPMLKDRLRDVIDAVHRLGKRRSDGPPRNIILRLTMRHYRDIIWKMAKGNKFLDEKKLRIKEDLIPQDQAAREKLAAYTEGKTRGKEGWVQGPTRVYPRKNDYWVTLTLSKLEL
jgi:uncharacterized coiled-coil protein SlyX